MYRQHLFQQSTDQRGMVAYPASVVNRTGKMNTFLSPFAPENLISGDGSGLHMLPTTAKSGAYSRDTFRFPRPCPHNIPFNAIDAVPTLSGRAMAYRLFSLPRVRRHRANFLQGSSSNGWCLFDSIMDEILYAFLFSHLL